MYYSRDELKEMYTPAQIKPEYGRRKLPEPPPNPNPNAELQFASLPKAAQDWLKNGSKLHPNRSVASMRVERGYVTVVSYPDYAKETFRAV